MATNFLERINKLHDNVFDDDEAIEIIGQTKEIKFPTTNFEKEIGVVGDHQSNIIGFKCPATIEQHFVYECSNIFIRWQNGSLSGTHYVKKDGNVLETIGDIMAPPGTPEEEKDEKGWFYFHWTITNTITQQAGAVSFQVCFRDEDETKIVFQWSSKVATGLSIGQSLMVDPENEYDPSDDEDVVLVFDAGGAPETE